MSPEHQQPNAENTKAEIAFVQQALADADRSARASRIIIGVLAILAIVAFVWMHHHLFPPDNLGGLLHSLLRVDLFFLVLAIRHHHVPSSCHEQEHPHHPPGPCQYPLALTASPIESGSSRPLFFCFQLFQIPKIGRASSAAAITTVCLVSSSPRCLGPCSRYLFFSALPPGH